jgi:hypothetical protein
MSLCAGQSAPLETVPTVKAADALARARQVLRTMESRHSIRSGSLSPNTSFVPTKATANSLEVARAPLQSRASLQPRTAPVGSLAGLQLGRLGTNSLAGGHGNPPVSYDFRADGSARVVAGDRESLCVVSGMAEPHQLTGKGQLQGVNGAAGSGDRLSARASLTRAALDEVAS